MAVFSVTGLSGDVKAGDESFGEALRGLTERQVVLRHHESTPLDNEKARAMSLRVPRGVVITSVDAAHYEGVEHPPAPGDVLARIAHVRPRDLDHLGLLPARLKPGPRVPLVIAPPPGRRGHGEPRKKGARDNRSKDGTGTAGLLATQVCAYGVGDGSESVTLRLDALNQAEFSLDAPKRRR